MTTTLRPLHGTQRPVGRLGRYATYAVCINGKQVGSIVLADHSPQGASTGWIERLHITLERRGRGLGAVALLIAEEVLRSWGCRRVALTVSAAASGGLTVARQLGYTVEACAMVGVLSAQPPLPPGGVLRPMRADEHGAWADADTAGCPLGPLDAAHAADAGEASTRPEVEILVLELAGESVGVLHLAYVAPDGAGGRGWIHRAVAVPGRQAASRELGHRRALLSAAARRCRAKGLREIGLTVAGEDPALFRLAGSLGYEVVTVRLGKQL